MRKFILKHRELVFLCFSSIFLLGAVYRAPYSLSDHYISDKNNYDLLARASTTISKVTKPVPSYIETPDKVRGVYMTSWIASSKKTRDSLVELINDTELNTIVIDIKDYSGKVFFDVEDPEIISTGSVDVRISDLSDFVEELHKKNIYVIARLAVFQDSYFVKKKPDLAVKNKAGTQVWKDRKGISWIDPGSEEYWGYIVKISKEARRVGFDEVNFDYIRFPSDGNMSDISYPLSSTTPKVVVLENFFKYIHENLKDSGLKTSADLFGLVTNSNDDMGIGQVLENALPYFDYISPMVYPSHYSEFFENINNPEANPYQTIYVSMSRAVQRINLASSTPDKLRPWLQDFSLKVKYGPKEVKDQIQAVYDAGVDSWLLWSASNIYTRSALEKESE
ncbi:MAG: putative glycoside hydrolase [Minisyncoccia bacterium]